MTNIIGQMKANPSRRMVCGHLLTGIAGSNPVRCMDVCFLWVLCVRQRSLRRADQSYRGILL